MLQLQGYWFYLFGLMAFCGPALHGQATSQSGILFPFDLQSLDGNIRLLSQNDKGHVRAFIFLSTTCPISNSYLPELNRLQATFPDQVEMYGIVSDPSTSRQKALGHFQQFDSAFPILFDSSQLLSDSLEPTHVPEAFVLAPSGDLIYRGAIDNAYESIGRRRAHVENHYLEDAVNAAVSGRKPLIHQTKPVGCVLPRNPTESRNGIVTYARDVAPILQRRCQTCHRPGQVAPFALTDYEEAKTHAEMIVEVTQGRNMPPWIPGPATAHRFVGQRWLGDRELAIIKQWLEGGCA